MISFPNAKINLGLNIIEKRSDGFHNLESCFYPTGWTDILEILPANQLLFESTGIPIPDDGNENLCLKAYHLLSADFDLPPVHIHLHKIIPIGAGLGGGSADAAFTIKTLNNLFGLKLTTVVMQDYARQLGSDCAFFIENVPKYCFGKGDQFKEIDIKLKDKFLVLVYPNQHVSTGEAYAGICPMEATNNLQEALQLEANVWKQKVKNDFEPQVFSKYPHIATIKTKLYEQGALYASLTGSGSTLFGIFDQVVTPDFSPAYTVYSQPLSI
ncbi:4-(cytidine 5'-diphospho)-2-C-methyl-D-erythritol kinase [uncultured Microscilla sp.]|uniref:4-(cytidine 5'-diphospho)-2-C-methyl-D-erythritol kinase n=1 Tax=uncultured Microscilla sp. TaxID=432653 RepID=UPI0026110EA9|nr:4-(cytidine 5'-diphospho)-2-C-methyl-D-erythritol kinase [uncultured Microscilla sp.]